MANEQKKEATAGQTLQVSAEDLAKVLGLSSGMTHETSDQEADELKLDETVPGGVYKVSDDPDASFINAYGERVDEEGYLLDQPQNLVGRRIRPPEQPGSLQTEDGERVTAERGPDGTAGEVTEPAK